MESEHSSQDFDENIQTYRTSKIWKASTFAHAQKERQLKKDETIRLSTGVVRDIITTINQQIYSNAVRHNTNYQLILIARCADCTPKKSIKMRDSPWFHHKRSESAQPAEKVKNAPSITLKEQDDITARISRPTESALYRQSLFWKLDSFMDKGFHSWSKMELFDDCKRSMWSKDGSIKHSCKIRPLEKTLPPIVCSSQSVKSCHSQRSICSSRSGPDGLNNSQSRCASRSKSSFDAGFGNSGFKRSGSLSVRGTSREGISFRRANLDNANHGKRNFGFLLSQRPVAMNSNAFADLAVPKLSARPMAAVGQRV